jgi:hypothetical protein
MWKQWVNALLGLITIGMALAGGLSGVAGIAGLSLAWTLGIIGLIVLALSLWTIGEVPREEYERAVHSRHSHA